MRPDVLHGDFSFIENGYQQKRMTVLRAD